MHHRERHAYRMDTACIPHAYTSFQPLWATQGGLGRINTYTKGMENGRVTGFIVQLSLGYVGSAFQGRNILDWPDIEHSLEIHNPLDNACMFSIFFAHCFKQFSTIYVIIPLIKIYMIRLMQKYDLFHH